MSFLNIEDPEKRDQIVKEYFATVKRIQQNNLNEKAKDLVRVEDIERAQAPVVRSTKQSTEAITNELKPIKDELKLLNERLENRKPEEEEQQSGIKKREKEEDPPIEDVVQLFYDKVPEDQLDKYFGIVKDGDRYKMGNRFVKVDGIDLIVDHKRYTGSKGFWNLIMAARPKEYTHGDFVKYRDLIARTNAMAYPNNVTSSSRVKTTKKWRSIFPKFNDLEVSPPLHPTRLTPSHHAETPLRNKEQTPSIHGEGIFLPGDIKGLQTKLSYLLAEYRAGNRSSSTRNEIVSILDELLRRKRISRREYKDINTFLG